MIRVTTVYGEKHFLEPSKFYSNAKRFADIVFSDNGVIQFKYVTSTKGVIISTKHIVTVENV